MKLLFTTGCLSLAAAVLLVPAAASRGQTPLGPSGYGPPPGMAPPAMPASPLAGGAPAAQGGAYMDVYGNPIVVPAQYCQDCQGGGGYAGGSYGGQCYGGGGCPPGAGGAGMYADFGGYGQDQCGPHYFDVAFDAVFLRDEERFDNVGALASVGVGNNAPRVLNPEDEASDYEAGWEAAVRLDFGPLSVLEATYMGIYDYGFDQTVRSVDVTDPSTDFQLFSAFSDFGLGTLVPGIDDGSVYRIRNEADIQSTEFSYRRYWVGARPRVSGTYLLGFRYLRYTDDFEFNSLGLNPAGGGPLIGASRSWGGENDMLGFQLGGDMSVCLRQGLRLNVESKAGVYNNRYRFRNAGDFADGVLGAPADFDVSTKGNQVAFAGEARIDLVADILPSWSLRGGYRILYLNSLAIAGDNIDASNISNTTVQTQSDVTFHGFHAGLEYIW